MKILHVAETAKGGVGTIINSLIKIKGVESYVILPMQHQEIIYSNNKIAFDRKNRGIKSAFNLIKCFIKHYQVISPDVVHVHSSFAGTLIRLLCFLKITGLKKECIIYTPHAFSFLMTNSSRIKIKIYSIIERVLQKYSKFIVCNSEFESNEAVRNGLSKSNLKVIYNGIVDNNNIDSLLIEPNGVDKEKLNLLYVGRFDYQKGYDYLERIIFKLVGFEKIDFHIVGDYVVNQGESIHSNNVKYYGWLDNANVSHLYKSCDVLIMPSRWESFGLVAVEAQMSGLPVVANNCSSLPEVVINNETGYLVNFDNIDEVVSLLISKSKFEWKNMKQNCIKFSKGKFTEEMMNENYFELYLGVINND